ncbi:uncharacterized protein PHACADRAFT_151262 [Phanerochaete carnosa HHB-10118-sp]|uniref:F-box domain-containing protein n=1 Tax=Phanerochaete carnosa (strain HHB-10118-sp) TaxID=650164 RepID=K5VVQ1_PHACS|nr:uncharacterized protein PHACADRAFT_151262 [Phanerochaete carnosa HHB-10118-sp]EKM50865.1 hypothetical protein PHACADRAFT_151262 [Phanerochaete carnosa HHB-10118-sp]
MASAQKTASPIHVPELLALVFSHLDNRNLARAARVCRQWADVALDTLWHTVTDLRPLLSLLAPLTGQKKSTGRATQDVRCHSFIVHKAPLLTKLEVRSHHATHELQDDLLPLFRGLRGLRHVVVPLYFLTGDLLATLAEVPQLETIELAAPVERGIGDSADVQDLDAALQQGAFPILRTLAFAAHIQHATRFLEQPAAPKNIATLHLHVLAVDTPPAVHDLFSTLAGSYSRLTELRLDFMLGPHSPTISSPPPPDSRPSLETLRPLAACAHLKTLEIRWDYELNVTEADLSTLAPSWPALEVLHLHSDAIPEHTPPQLSLRALLPFARHCPRLRSLALYVDGDGAPLPPPGTPLPAFRALGTLAFGSSPLRGSAAAALFLSALLPPSCVVSAGVRWPDAFGIALDRAGVIDERRLHMAEWWAHWKEVGRSVPLLVRARADERARVLAAAKDGAAGELEEGVERLRVRMGG